MDTLHTILASGYAPMGIAIVALWKSYKKAKEDHLSSLKENERALAEIKDLIRKGQSRG